MNIMQKLTWNQMKKNKRRTLVTIIGVIMSVALLTAVTTTVNSFLDVMRRHAAARSGSWHLCYYDVPVENRHVIEDDADTKEVIYSTDVGYAMLAGGQNAYKPYLFIKSYDGRAMEYFPIQILEGRYPENSSEIMVPEHVETNGGVKINIGDVLTLETGKRMSGGQELTQSYSYLDGSDGEAEHLEPETVRTYTVTGIIARPDFESRYAPGYTCITYLDEELMAERSSVNMSVVLKDPSSGLYAHSRDLAEKAGMQSLSDDPYAPRYAINYNSGLLEYYGLLPGRGGVMQVIYMTMVVIMIILMVGSVSLIYNAFAISLSERSRYLGMLAGVGATRRQKRSSVYFEAFVVGIISIPAGVLLGTVGIGITLHLVQPLFQSITGYEEPFRMAVSGWAVVLTVIFAAATLFLSAWIPAGRASRIMPIDAIRQTGDVKLTRRKVRTMKLTRWMFGVEADIALKNMKRNKGRYRTTCFALVISILLFLSVSAYTSYMNAAYGLTSRSEEGTFDIQVKADGGLTSDQAVKFQMAGKEVERLYGDEIQSVIYSRSMYINAVIPYGELTQKQQEKQDVLLYMDEYGSMNFLSEREEEIAREDEVVFSTCLVSYDEKYLREFAKQAGVSYEDMTDPDNPGVIVMSTSRFTDNGKYALIPAFERKKGEALGMADVEYFSTGMEDSVEEYRNELQYPVLAMVEEPPVGFGFTQDVTRIVVVMSEDTMLKFCRQREEDMQQKGWESYMSNTMMIDTQSETLSERIRTQFDKYMEDNNYWIQDALASRRETMNMNNFISVFLYSFVILVTAICVANMFNTISTSISLRRREFAMLRSMGMTPQGFRKMMLYESLFYGMKALIYGLPLSFGVMILLLSIFSGSFAIRVYFPWKSILLCIAGVFLLVSVIMLYSSSKMKKMNIIDGLKEENL